MTHYRKVHIAKGCGDTSKHFGGRIELTFEQFKAHAASIQCTRCLASKRFAFLTRLAAKKEAEEVSIPPVEPSGDQNWYARDRALIEARCLKKAA